MSPRSRNLVIASLVFSVACLVAYLLRQDYFFKQSDQLYYLSLADSLRTTGHLNDRTLVSTPLPVSANSGVVFLMAPFVGLGWDGIARILSFLYLLAHLSTFFPLFKVLERLGMKRDTAATVVALYFFSFPVTLYQLWPVNEGGSFALISWFLYFLFVRKSLFGSVVMAFLAPLFRIHIVLVELGVLLAWRREKKTLKLTLASLAASVAAMGLFALAFPYQHILSKFDSGSSPSLRGILIDVLQTPALLFVPQTVLQRALGESAALGGMGLGLLITVLVFSACAQNIRRGKCRELSLFSAVLFFAGLVYVALTPAVMARYLAFILFWIIAVIALMQDRKVLRVAAIAYVVLNGMFLVSYAAKIERAPNFSYLSSVRTLGIKAPPNERYPIVYFDESLPIHPRHIYAYFRRPSDGTTPRFVGRFLYLSERPRALESKLAACRYTSREESPLTLFIVDCASSK